MKLVRLNPRDPARGNTLGSYSIPTGKRSVKFNSGVWYQVDDTMAEYLAKVKQNQSIPHSPLAFSVCATEADATALVKREREESERGKRPEDAIAMAQDFTTAALPKPVASLSPDAARAAEEEEAHEFDVPPPKPVGTKAEDEAKKEITPKRSTPAKRSIRKR